MLTLNKVTLYSIEYGPYMPTLINKFPPIKGSILRKHFFGNFLFEFVLNLFFLI
jgi:hypothetical protein